MHAVAPAMLSLEQMDEATVASCIIIIEVVQLESGRWRQAGANGALFLGCQGAVGAGGMTPESNLTATAAPCGCAGDCGEGMGGLASWSRVCAPGGRGPAGGWTAGLSAAPEGRAQLWPWRGRHHPPLGLCRTCCASRQAVSAAAERTAVAFKVVTALPLQHVFAVCKCAVAVGRSARSEAEYQRIVRRLPSISMPS